MFFNITDLFNGLNYTSMKEKTLDENALSIFFYCFDRSKLKKMWKLKLIFIAALVSNKVVLLLFWLLLRDVQGLGGKK